MKKGEKKIGKWTVEVHKMEGLYPYVRLEDFMKVCKGLEEENKKLKDDLRIAQGLVEKYEEIEIKMGKENKNLKLIQETNEKQLKNDIKERDELREENKKLKAELSRWQQGKYRYFGNDGETDLYECMEEDTLQELKDIGEI